jgi:predicted  nucleic acid-binding Zn-ribbon protein
MPEDAGLIWNFILTAAGGSFIWWVRGISSQVQDVRLRISDTREEVAKTYVTKGDLQQDMKDLMSRFDRLEEKFDRLMVSRSVP